jgi:FAD/FMN-containing dehydrogenase
MQQLLSVVVIGSTGLLHCSRLLAQTVTRGLERIAGKIIHRGDAAYPAWWASMTWYIFKPQRYPATIVRVESEKDVIATVNYARENQLKIAVRSTGHNPAKAVLRDGGILLDLALLRGAEVDATSRTAWIQPGIRAQELLKLTTQHGLAFPAAHTGIVGLGGYLLGGGVGWNMPEYGIACRSILGVEMITADGKKVFVSRDENQELHWAVRGVGPGFFAAVVRYQLQLYPVHRAIKVSQYVIPMENLTAAMAEFTTIGEVCDKRLETIIKIGRFHPADKPYAERDLVCTVGFFAFADTEDDAEALMSPVAQSKIAELSILKKESVPITYDDLYVPPETDHSSPGRTTVENMWTEDPGRGLQLLAEKMMAGPPPSPRSFLLCGWSFNTTFSDESSCVRTGARHYMSWYMIAEKEEDIEPNYQWMDEAVELMRPLAAGRYINEIDPVRYPQHVQECFSPADWERLEQLRRQYDPQGVFHTYLGPDGPNPES